MRYAEKNCLKISAIILLRRQPTALTLRTSIGARFNVTQYYTVAICVLALDLAKSMRCVTPYSKTERLGWHTKFH